VRFQVATSFVSIADTRTLTSPADELFRNQQVLWNLCVSPCSITFQMNRTRL